MRVRQPSPRSLSDGEDMLDMSSSVPDTSSSPFVVDHSLRRAAHRAAICLRLDELPIVEQAHGPLDPGREIQVSDRIWKTCRFH